MIVSHMDQFQIKFVNFLKQYDFHGLAYLIAQGNKPKNLARFIATASSRCFFVETAVILEGMIFPLSEINF